MDGPDSRQRVQRVATGHDGGGVMDPEKRSPAASFFVSGKARFESTPFSTVLVISLCAGIAAFFFIHAYRPDLGIVWNVIHGQILLTDECNLFSDIAPADSWCDTVIGYRWIVAALICLIAASWLVHSKPKPH
jgi:hypothetical protein